MRNKNDFWCHERPKLSARLSQSPLTISLTDFFVSKLFHAVRKHAVVESLQISSEMNGGKERDSTRHRIHRTVRAAICDMCSSMNALCYLRQMAAITHSLSTQLSMRQTALLARDEFHHAAPHLPCALCTDQITHTKHANCAEIYGKLFNIEI